MKKHNLRCNHCGTDHYVSQFFLYLKLIILGDVNVVCSDCGYVSNYILVSHVVHDTTNIKEKEFNRKLEEGRRNAWKKC